MVSNCGSKMFDIHQEHIGFVTISCFVYNCSPGMQKCCQGPAYENVRWRLRPEILRHSVSNSIFVQNILFVEEGRPIQRA